MIFLYRTHVNTGMHMQPTISGALGNCHSALRRGIQKAPKVFKWCKRHALDAASRCGMTVTDSLDCSRMQMFETLARHAPKLRMIPKRRQNAMRKAVFRTLKGRLLASKRRPFANALTVNALQSCQIIRSSHTYLMQPTHVFSPHL